MAVIHAPPTPPAGPLFWASWYMRGFSDHLNRLGNDLEGVWLIGTHLAYPFQIIASYAKTVSNWFNTADTSVQNAISWINHVINGTGFLDLLYWASGHFWAIRNDPKNWIKGILNAIDWRLAYLAVNPLGFTGYMIRQVSGYISWLIDNPLGLVSLLFRQLAWYGGLILDNPSLFIKHFFGQISYAMALLLASPASFINSYIRQVSPLLGTLIDNPIGWLWGLVIGLSYDLAQFISNPRWYLQQQIAYMLGLPPGFWADPFYHITEMVLYKIRTRQGTLGSTLASLIIDLILVFM